MVTQAQLFIRRTPGSLRPQWGRQSVNELRGGPETLLRWLETQLGIPVAPAHKADRITEYAAALDSLTSSVISASLKSDRWATATELLTRRDELLLAGWKEDAISSDRLPEVVHDLACAAKGRAFAFPGEAHRLQRVLNALDAGQILPPHRCVLSELPNTWPIAWRNVLAKMNLASQPAPSPHGPAESALHVAQCVVRGGDITKIMQDPSLRYVHARSETSAVEFVVAALAHSPTKLSTTVICCEDDNLALRIDACLNRIGLPTTGASAWSRAHPVLQVLPLLLTLCWEPVDPQALLDFLSLPITPLPKQAASRLANALAQEPGLGSGQWEKTITELCNAENDPDGLVRKRLNDWLLGDRTPTGTNIPSRLVRSRCSMVAQWASGRSALLKNSPHADSNLIEALQYAAGQASLLGELAESQGPNLSEPQLGRLLEEALEIGVETVSCIEASGGPIRVRSLSEIDGPCERLIWLGLGTADASGCRWSTDQLRKLRDAAIDVDDGSSALSALRSAEASGFSYVKEAFLAVLLPQDQAKRWHPIWLAIRGLFPANAIEHPLVVEELIAAADGAALKPFEFESRDVAIEPPQKLRPLWDIPAHLLADREGVSATELQDRLGCPLKWTLKYQAKLRPSPIARLPDDFKLKGTFCHSIFDRVFGGGGALPTVDAAVAKVVTAFNERLPLDAAPLAQPNKSFERERLRSQLVQATRVLVGALASGGYRIVGIEVELAAEAFGKTLNGWMDCVAARDNGEEAIIDFKYGGMSKYYSLLEEGKAVQLATYAYGRATKQGTFPAVAYLVIANGLLYTPSGSPVHGDGNRSLINAPSVHSVWQRFSDALNRAGEWLTTDVPVPARPLQDSTQWPADSTLVLQTRLKAGEKQEVCKYCDYQLFCGIQATS